MAKTLEKLLVTRGVYGSVEHSVTDSSDNSGPRLQFNVVGAPIQLAKLSFTDPAAEIMTQVATRRPDVVGQPYSRFTLALFAAEQIRPEYLKTGHLKVSFGTRNQPSPAPLQSARKNPSTQLCPSPPARSSAGAESHGQATHLSAPPR